MCKCRKLTLLLKTNIYITKMDCLLILYFNCCRLKETTEMTKKHAKFSKVNLNKSLRVRIVSVNNEGQSLNNSQILIPGRHQGRPIVMYGREKILITENGEGSTYICDSIIDLFFLV